MNLRQSALETCLRKDDGSVPDAICVMPYLNSRLRTPRICPVCGEDVPPRALACPECGADHKSGWKKDAYNEDGLDLPDDEFNYDEFIKKEFGAGEAKPKRVKLVWWLTGLVILAILLWLEFEGK